MKVYLFSFLSLFFLLQNVSAEENFLYAYKEKDNYFMKIPEKTLQRDILVSTTILQGAAKKTRSIDMRFGYGGDAVYSKMIRLVKNDNNIDIVSPEIYLNDLTPSIYKKYNDSSMNLSIESFPIKSHTDGYYIIDITNFINSDDALVSLKGAKEELKLGSYIESQSYIMGIKSYSQNINFRSYRSYTSGDAQEKDPTSWVVGVSWMLLPEVPMEPRILNMRVGYFSTQIKGSLIRNDINEKTNVANHWRLEPKLEDIEKYKRGELVEPAKPIVFYIDRSTPGFLVPYFINAVKVWNAAFEKAGFKDAITAKLAPTAQEDSTYSEEDMRYSLISYKASPIPNAYGPMVVDPRSGEILNSHVAVFYSVLQLLQRWYFTMCGAADPQAREYPLSQDIMGKLAAMVVTHEVGHTLGLLHNFAGSTVYDTDSLRNLAFVHHNGIGASVMDYERFDYVVQPGDGFKGEDFMPHLGAYDKFAIEWGYRLFPNIKQPKVIAENLEKWVDDKRKQDQRLFFLSETDLLDPRVQSEDCGSDQIKANTLCIKNLELDMENLERWNPKQDSDYFVLRKRYLSILSHYDNCMGHVLRYIAGRYTDNPSVNEKGYIYTPVSYKDQKRAMDFISKNVFNEPEWLFRKDIMDKTKVDFDTYENNVYSTYINKLIYKCIALDNNMQIDPHGFSTEDVINYMKEGLFISKGKKKSLSRYDRMLQDAFVMQMSICAENGAYFLNGYSALAQKAMMDIKKNINEFMKRNTNSIDKAHYQAINDFITIWQTGKQKDISYQQTNN